MSTEPIRVSVIIPTKNRMDILRQTLDALRQQVYAVDYLQVIVALDGCVDGTREMLRNYLAPFSLHVVESPSSGPAATRNHGAEQASGELLIFLDDDIEVCPGFIQAHVDAHRDALNRVVIGYLPPVISNRSTFFSLELRGSWEAKFHTMRQPGRRFNYTDLLSGNFSIRREVFQQMSGFNTAFKVHEDYEFGMRLILNKVVFTYSEPASGYHKEFTNLDRALERKVQEGLADVLLGQHYPELIPTLSLWRLLKYSLLPSHIMRMLRYRVPWLGDIIASVAKQSLVWLERVHFVGTWRRVIAGLTGYWYWKGVTQALPTPRALKEFLRGAPAKGMPGKESAIRLDLDMGLEEAENILDKERPESAKIYYRGTFLGCLNSAPGTEHWRGTHLRPFLIKHSLFPFLLALGKDNLVQLPATIDKHSPFYLADPEIMAQWERDCS